MTERDPNLPIHHQSWGTCWAHSTILSLESLFFFEGKEPQQFNPYYLDKFNGFNKNGKNGDEKQGQDSGQSKKFIGSNSDDSKSGVVVHQGGDFLMAIAALANLGGVPSYSTNIIGSDHNDFKKFGDTPYDGILKTSSDYRFFMPTHMEILDDLPYLERVFSVKSFLMKNGAVSSSQKIQEEPVTKFKEREVHFYNGKLKPTHAINIIGWDDTFRYKNLTGAWLVQDSDHRNNKRVHIGRFYIPYEDVHILKYPKMGAVLFYDLIETHFKEILTHALHGWRYTTDSEILEVAVSHEIKSVSKLVGVGLYMPKSKALFEISYSDKLDGKRLPLKKGQIETAGFHYIKLEHPVTLTTGKIFVFYKIDKGGYPYDASFAMDVALHGETDRPPVMVNSKANPNESFYLTSNGWRDFTDYLPINRKILKNRRAQTDKSANIAMNLYLE